MPEVVEFEKELYKALGGKRVLKREPPTPTEMVAMLRKGLPSGVVEAIATATGRDLGDVLDIMHMPTSTWHRRKQKRTLKAVESDRVYRLARVTARAVEAIGDEDRARLWLRESNLALGGQAPFDMLDTEAGVQQVLDVLTRTEHGVYS